MKQRIKNIIQKTSKAKNLFFQKLNKIDKPLARLKREKKSHDLQISGMKIFLRGNIPEGGNAIDSRDIIRKHCE